MKKININFIPPHFNCKNCGECCGIVPISIKEYETIKNYCIGNNIKPLQKQTFFDCMFRDNKKGLCLIYDVRPTICKLFGVTKGMDCDNGNSNNIDGRSFLDNKDAMGMIKLYKELMKK
jgi:Fe-S-cluster containining protein